MTDTNFELKNGADAKRVSASIKHASLFTGIGGFDIAAEWMGWENVFQVEIDKWCQKVLAKNFPNVTRYADIKETDFTAWKNKVDILTGGFPCQPVSIAGKQAGDEDERYLWGEMRRTIKQVMPSIVVAENVPGLLTWKRGILFEQVCIDLENLGYEVQPVIIPAASKDAPHKRERIWFVAYNDSKWQLQSKGSEQNFGNGFSNLGEDVSYTNGFGQQEQRLGIKSKNRQLRQRNISKRSDWWEVEPGMGRVVDGLSGRVDRLKGLGNAIVPQVAYELFRCIDFCIKSGAFFNSKFVLEKTV